MIDEEPKLLEVAAEYHILFTELIERALLRSQQLCGEIESGNPNAIETASEIEQKLSNIWDSWNRLADNKLKSDLSG